MMNDDKTELITIGSKSKLKQVSTNSMGFFRTVRLNSLNQYGILVCSWMSLSQ